MEAMAIQEQSAPFFDTVDLARLPSLTAREAQVLELLAEGHSTRTIAGLLSVSEQAITYHVGNMLSKFGCESRVGVVARAFVLGYLDSGRWPPRLVSRNPSGEGRTRAR